MAIYRPVYNSNGEKFPSTGKAAKAYCGNASHIAYAARNNRMAYGLYWSYLDEAQDFEPLQGENKLRYYMRMNGISISELSYKADVSRPSISQWTNNSGKLPNSYSLYRLAKALNLSMDSTYELISTSYK